MSDWKTAAEWAAEGLNELPRTERGLNKLSESGGWRALGSTHARKRAGRGGGWEYHLTCLPEAAQADWARRRTQQLRATAVEQRATEVAAAVQRAPDALSARRREVMQARAAVLTEIERRTIEGAGWDRAMRTLLADAAAGALSSALISTLALASDRKRSPVPSPRTIYNWKAALSTGGIHALAPVRAEQQTKAAPPAWLNEVLRFRSGTNPSLSHALEMYARRQPPGAPIPSYAQVQRAVKALAGTSRFLDAFTGREGPLKLKARLGFVRRTTEGMDPTTVYTADGKTFDAAVAHPVHGKPFRPEITTVIDVVTRRVVGWSVDLAENSRGVADALRRACEFGGIPAIFYTDNGSGYRNQALDHETLGMAAALGITTTHSLPYNSQARGIIERANGTIWNRLAQEFVTYQGPLVDREYKEKVYKRIKGEIAVTGESRTLPSWDDFLAAVQRAISDYNDRAHSALKIADPATGRPRKASPNEYWADFVARGFEPVPLTSAEADDLFRPTFRRTVRRGEVQWNNNQYFHPALEPYHGIEVLVGIEITDASRVWVRRLDLVDGAPQPGALICVAEYWMNKERYMPVSMEQSSKEKRARGRLRRIEDKQGDIESELHGVALLQNSPSVPAPFLDMPEPMPIAASAPAPVAFTVERPSLPGRKVASYYIENADVELAAESLADPASLTPGRVRLLTEFLRGRHAVEMLQAGGVNPDELETLLGSYTAPAADQVNFNTSRVA